MVWTLALVRSAGVVFPVFWRRVINGNGAYSVRMAPLTWRPGRFVHLAFNTEASGAVASTAAWFDGAVAAGADIALSALTAAPQGIVSVGGAIEAPEWIAGTERYSTLVPFSGVVDELRITTASRYAAYTTPAIDLPAAARVIPWPNY